MDNQPVGGGSATTTVERDKRQRLRPEHPVARRAPRKPVVREIDGPRQKLSLVAPCDYHARMLTDIYNWFTEGFDTADLRDAKALLDDLSN
jgi:hypothetical protein